MFKLIITVLILTFTVQASQFTDCNFLSNEIKRYEHRLRFARDAYEARKYSYILNKYKYSFMSYCMPRSGTQQYQQPFRKPQSQQSGYLGY